MRRFFVSPDAVADEFVTVTASEDVAHISKVLRMKVGDIIDISDSIKWEYKCEITEIHGDAVVLKIIDKQAFSREPGIKVTLFQGVPKKGKMETIVQKTTELGICGIVPVFMTRCIVADTGKYFKKVIRYNTIAQQAAKQCRRGIVPTVEDAVDFDEMIRRLSDFDKVIFPYENEENITIKQVLRSLEGSSLKDIALIIGPEGGFTEKEAERLIEAGAVSASLGRTILRTETAGIAALSMVMYELEL